MKKRSKFRDHMSRLSSGRELDELGLVNIHFDHSISRTKTASLLLLAT